MKQYYELQEPAKETIHIFGNKDFEEVFLDTKIIGFIKDEECKLIRFENHISKYKIEFHEEYSFTKEMKYILCFIDIDDESGFEVIQNGIETNEISNFLIFVQNQESFSKDEEQNIIAHLKTRFTEISDKIEELKLKKNIK